MKPLLAHIYEPHRVTYPCYVQPKLNGIRALYQNGVFVSRDEIVWEPQVLRHLWEPLKEIFPPDAILDGELYVHGWPLQRINAAVTPVRQEPTEDTVKVEYHVFDVVDFNRDFDTRFQTAYTRWQLTSPYKIVDHWRVDNEHEANRFYSKFVADGYEGLMYRLGKCPYTVPKQPLWYDFAPPKPLRAWSDKDNRTFHLLKRKDWHDDEFPILAFRETVGEKGERGFVLTCQSKSPTKPTFDVGSGLTQSEIDHYLEVSPIGRKAKVKYLVLSADQIPLNPTILCIL